MRLRSGIGRPRKNSGSGIGRLRRAANSFWPKYHETRAAWAVSKASLSRAVGMMRKVTTLGDAGHRNPRIVSRSSYCPCYATATGAVFGLAAEPGTETVGRRDPIAYRHDRYELTCRNSLINQANLVEVDNNPNGACHDKFSAR